MQRKTSPALLSADAPTSPTPQSRDHEHPWIAWVTVRFFAGIWKLINFSVVSFLIGGVGVSFATSWLSSQNSANPSTWLVSNYLDSLGEHLLVAGTVIGLFAFVALVALWADTTKHAWDKEKEDAKQEAKNVAVAEKAGVAVASALAKREGTIALDTYDPTPVREIKPNDCGVSSDNFVKDVYLKREDGDEDNDVTVRRILRGLATRQAGGEGTIGIHIVGPHNMGKSRLVWEALTHLPDLQDWTLIKWQSSEDRPFPIETMKGKDVIVLLDRLEEYAKSAGPRVSPLNKLQAKFSAVKIPLIVLATSDGADRKVTEKLAPLLSSLEKIELRAISPDEAERLKADLKQYNETYPPKEHIEIHDWDGATPGSIVVGQATSEQYEKLSVGARQVLKILKLFNSAGIGNDPVYITKARVSAVADALFDIPRLRWRAASDKLINEGWVNVQLVSPTRARAISITSNDVLDIVNDYPLGLTRLDKKANMELEEWPLLYQVFRDTRDAEALVALGLAWRNSTFSFTDSSMPTKLDYLMRAADCYRTALADRYRGSKETKPFDCALAEWNLADVLTGQNSCMLTTDETPTRLDILEEAAASYQAALEFFTYAYDPDSWLLLTASLAQVLSDQSRFVEADDKAARLAQAQTLGRSAFTSLTPAASADVKTSVKTVLATINLYRAQIAARPEEAVELETEAYALVSAALQDRRQEDPDGQNKEALAQALGLVGYVNRFRASLAPAQARADLFGQIERQMRAAFAALGDSSSEGGETPPSETPTWTQSVLAETLLQHARLTSIASDAQRYLSEAADLSLNVISAPIMRNLPEPLAWVHGIYAGVLAEQAKHAPASERETLLNKALDYAESALAVNNRQSVPEDWAGTRFNCAVLFLQAARFVEADNADDARSYVSQAQQCLVDALDVYTSPAFLLEREQALSLGAEIEQYEQTLKVAS